MGNAILPLEQAEWVERAWEGVDPDRLGGLLASMVGISSPPGEELELAEFLAEYLEKAGLSAEVQRFGDRQANAVGRLGGSGDGPDLLLY
ncbi:MAG: deacylase, partial [Actinomycetota bacterium]